MARMAHYIDKKEVDRLIRVCDELLSLINVSVPCNIETETLAINMLYCRHFIRDIETISKSVNNPFLLHRIDNMKFSFKLIRDIITMLSSFSPAEVNEIKKTMIWLEWLIALPGFRDGSDSVICC